MWASSQARRTMRTITRENPIFRLNCYAYSSVAKYPTAAENAILDTNDNLFDKKVSHLVCAKCSSPIARTQDLFFFKWKGGFHVSSLTDAPLQYLHSIAVDQPDPRHPSKKYKLHCLTCQSSIGAISTIFSSEKLLFKAKSVAIQMPEHQSPMVSLSGYPSSILTFNMWTELLLLLESQSQLKEKLKIKRIHNIREFTVEIKEWNNQIMLASNLRELLAFVDKHLLEMNALNILSAFVRAAVLKGREKRRLAQKPLFPTQSQAPEDEFWNLSVQLLGYHSEENCAIKYEVNTRLWNLVDIVEGLISVERNDVPRLMQCATAMWRLNIGRPSFVKELGQRTLNLASPIAISNQTNNTSDQKHKLRAYEASVLASCIANLSTQSNRKEPWMYKVLCAAADIVLADEQSFQVSGNLIDIVLSLVRSFMLVGTFHEEITRRFFAAVNAGLLDTPHASSRVRPEVWRARIFQIHYDNLLAKRGTDFELNNAPECPSTVNLISHRESTGRREKYQQAFAELEKNQKQQWFRLRHLVVTALESMKLKVETQYVFKASGYMVDVALTQPRIAIEIIDEDSFLAEDPRSTSVTRVNKGVSNILSLTSDQAPVYLHTMLPYPDVKRRHLEYNGWIVVHLPAEPFEKLEDEASRIEYLSVLIEVATQSRSNL